jgi:hypothetical protein
MVTNQNIIGINNENHYLDSNTNSDDPRYSLMPADHTNNNIIMCNRDDTKILGAGLKI